MAGIRTYNAGKVTVIFNGFNITGFADGTFINITQQNDGITTQVGADGELARAVNTDRRCTVTVTLQQTSPANDFLSSMYSIDVLLVVAALVLFLFKTCVVILYSPHPKLG